MIEKRVMNTTESDNLLKKIEMYKNEEEIKLNKIKNKLTELLGVYSNNSQGKLAGCNSRTKEYIDSIILKRKKYIATIKKAKTNYDSASHLVNRNFK